MTSADQHPKPNTRGPQDNIASAVALRASAPYIRAHRGRTAVVHLPGEAAYEPGFSTLIEDLALLTSLGMRLVVVLGARPQINVALNDAGVETRLVDGIRVTSSRALAEVKKAVGAHVIDIEAIISTSLAQRTLGGGAAATASGNFTVAKPLGVVDGVDFEHTGEVRRVDTASIHAALDRGQILLMSAIGYSPSGEIFNIFTEDLATFAAIELQADKLILLHGGSGLAGRVPAVGRQLDEPQAQRYASGTNALLESSDRSLLGHAARACRGGVTRTHLVSFAEPDAVLREIYSRDGAGTMVSAGGYDTLRKATADDLTGILALIEPLAEAGVLVERSREAIELDIDYYRVMVRDGLIIACAALVPYPDAGAAELACVAVHPDYRGQSRAAELLDGAEREAAAVGLTRLFALTTRTPHWFIEHGFAKATRKDLPVQRQSLYNEQRNSTVLIKSISTIPH